MLNREGLKTRMDDALVSFKELLLRESGQDLIEYSLLLAFICLAGAAALISMGATTNILWSVANSRLAAANGGS